MANFTRTNTFVAATTVTAAGHNQNWTGLETFLNSTGVGAYQNGTILNAAIGAAAAIDLSKTARYIAGIYLANSGTPTHTDSGNAQKVGAGGGTGTYTSEFDVRPSGVSAQSNTTSKRLDVQATGLYLVQGNASFGAISVDKTLNVGIRKNGTTYIAQTDYKQGVAGSAQMQTLRIVSLTAGDYLELMAYQDDSASEGYSTALSIYNSLQMMYLGTA